MICKEIEQILAMDTSNFDELISIWKILKCANEDTIEIDEEDQLLERDLETLHTIKKRQKDREEALALEKQKKLEAEKAKEEEIKKKKEEEIEEAETLRKQKI